MGVTDEQWYRKGLFSTLKDLQTSVDGLSPGEAKRRLEEYGPNRLDEKKKTPLILKFLAQFKSVLIIILIFAAILSAWIGLRSEEGSLLVKLSDTIVILIVITINAVIGFFQEYRAEQAMDALKKMTNPHAKVVRGGNVEEIPAEELVPGDVIMVEEGVKVPADAYIVDANNLRVDESALTGESVSVSKDVVAYLEELPLSKQKNMLFSTTIVTGGNGRGAVVRTGVKTEIGKIATMVQSTDVGMTPLQRRLDKLGKQIAIYAAVVCLIVLGINIWRSWGDLGMDDLNRFLLTSISLAVAVIPEGLPVIVIVTLAIGIREMAKKNAIIRHIPSVETLGGTTVICSDKTGTLTRNEMTSRKIFIDNGFVSVTGEGYGRNGKFIQKGKPVNWKKSDTFDTFLKACVLCNNSTVDTENSNDGEDAGKPIGDSTENALLILGMKAEFEPRESRERYKRIKEYTFDSALKRMSTVNNIDGSFYVLTKGAPTVVADLCTSISRNGKIVPFTEKERKKIMKANNRMAAKALRVLAVAYKKIDVPSTLSGDLYISKYDREDLEKDLVFLGLVGMIDPPREETKRAIKLCQRAGVRVVMITGDQKPTALAIGRELGIIKSAKDVLTGPELEKMGESELEEQVEHIGVFSMAVPAHKLSVISALKKKGHVVAMTGDGVNDAPALTKADIGISMGITGTDVAKEASDMILTDDNFGTIERAIEAGRKIYNNIRRFIRFQLSTNVGAILVILTGALSPSGDLPLLPAQILWINIIMDGPPAVALAMEPGKGDVMNQPPIDPKKGIITKKMLASIILLGIFMCIGTLYVFYATLNAGFSLVKAQTMAFTIFVLYQLFNVFNCRSDEESIFGKGFFKNKYILWAVGACLVLQVCVVYVPFLQDLFHTEALTWMDWLTMVIMSSLILAVDEVYVMAIGHKL